MLGLWLQGTHTPPKQPWRTLQSDRSCSPTAGTSTATPGAAEELPGRWPRVLAEVDGAVLLEEQEDEAMVTRPHGREGGQVMAQLLASLDVTAWDVGPEHRDIYTHFPPADSSRTANRSALL